ncbi:MAG: zinc-dependent metalloprotease [Rubricoccaceae bacterium]|nr:zinc-dependent metalloprotease [Rubricoccaceae bacterium]
MRQTLLLFSALLIASAPVSAQTLLQPADIERDQMTSRQSELLAHLESLSAFVEAEIVTVDLEALQQSSVSLRTPAGDLLSIDQAHTEANLGEDVASFTWYGQPEPSGETSIFVVRGSMVTGTIRANSQLFFLRPLSGDLHALALMDENAFIDHEPDFAEVEARSAAFYQTRAGTSILDAIRAGNAQGGNMVYVIVGYTPMAASQVGDIDALILLAIAETNTGYSNSDIEPRAALAHKFETAQNGSGSFSTDVPRLIATSDGWYDEIHPLRDTYGADVGILMTRNYGSSCGRASTILADDATEAFAGVAQDCATGYYTFAHEIGHLQGARHNPETDPSSSPFTYGHGKYYAPGSWRTVMSYNCSSGCTRVLHWSNPDVDYLGEPTGDVTLRDNARVLDETAEHIADFRPDPIPVELISFTGILDNQRVLLEWSTSSETNNAGFEVQRAAPEGWTVLGFVSGHGTTTEAQSYSFFDVGLDATSGSATYRLKQIDYDGAFEYSAEIEVSLGTPDSFALNSAYPNPFNPSTTVTFTLPATTDVRVDVLDVLGRQVATLAQGMLDAGYHTATWEPATAPSGTYIVRMIANGRSSTYPITLLK